jgi:dihydroflavonol-4-reductase
MILVTGASGLIGNQICNQLTRLGIPTRGLIRNRGNISDCPANGIEWIEGDILDFESLSSAMEGISTVIHTAAIVSFHRREYKLMSKTNVDGTANMVNAALDAKVQRFIHISSVAALGRTSNTPIISEDSKWVKSHANSYYGETKHLSELEVWRGAEEGLSTVVVNPSVVLGIGDWGKSSTKIFKYVWDEHKYYPAGSFNFVDLRDVAEAVIKLVNSNIESARFILSNGKISYKNFFEKVAKEFGKKPPSKLASYRLSKMILFVEKIRSLLSGKLPLVTNETLLMSKVNFEYENSKIKKTIGFQFRDLDSTVNWACAGLKR